ncbi:MAG: bifunctional 5,10-methylenetetrahydrofolate dehydrogenase/5,10-methenyltetrahydrofolate cyclohydrolase [Patescibacteria group bacterium]|jgi:methylenetetrahydrofolate dehydrogenase (NADP+)/methenyltetrahydrofolate cyclohydrolase
MFDGKQIREEILKELADKIVLMDPKPILAEIVVGEDPVVLKYAELKKNLAEKVGITFNIYQFESDAPEEEILECIEFLNDDFETNGIMIQIPMPKSFDRAKLITAISPAKDVDGLRYCQGLDSDFRPPVAEAILEALKRSEKDLKTSQIALIGHGFLVGKPLEKALKDLDIQVSVFESGSSIAKLDKFDIVISATGKAGIIKPEMVSDDVVLIDAGTAEENGELKGDIDPETYKKALYYTPVPGGIGPVTVAMLFRNLVSK